LLPLIFFVAGLTAGATASCAEMRIEKSSPPDTTNYMRPAVPEDSSPGGKPALGPNVKMKTRRTHRRVNATGSPVGTPTPKAAAH
jgi:hypothetical protein